MKALLKKLNNFRLTTIIACAISLAAIIISLLLVVFYEFAAVPLEVIKQEHKISATAFNENEILGMIYFLSCTFSVILGIFVIYKSMPVIVNKEKLVPSKGILWTAVVNGLFQLILFVLIIILLGQETPITLAGYIISLIVTLLTSLGYFALIVPLTQCEFYMPELKK